jgi:P27 family predicted phage terminase small subunit
MPRRSRAEREAPHLVEVDHTIESPPPDPPEYLSEAMKSWWRSVTGEFVLEAHHLFLLEAAAGAWDRMTAAREILAKDGMTVTTATGEKQHPCVGIERDARAAFARLLRELDLDVQPPKSDQAAWRPPPPLRSNRR